MAKPPEENAASSSNKYIIRSAGRSSNNPSVIGNDSISANLCSCMSGSRRTTPGSGFRQRSYKDLLLFFHLSGSRFCFGFNLRDSFDVQNGCKAILCSKGILPGRDKDWNGSGIKPEDFQVLPTGEKFQSNWDHRCSHFLSCISLVNSPEEPRLVVFNSF